MNSQNKILESGLFLDTIHSWKNQGEKIVFTNGCFDILHPGHIDLLERARSLGDKLVIGLNTDNSVSRNKGASRPINNEVFRSRMLAALQCVDLITFFNEDKPIDLIMKVSPDILVKGSDYDISDIVGAKEVLDNGGMVKTISLLPGFSTTDLISRIESKTKLK